MSRKSFFSGILDALFPRETRCALCDVELGEWFRYNLCPECQEDLDSIADYACVKCGRRVGPFALEGACSHCLGSGTLFRGGYSAFTYTEGAQHLIYGFKYYQKPWLAHSMAQMMSSGILELNRRAGIDFMVPVPIHGSRFEQRGYNQAALLAKEIEACTQIPWCAEVLFRVKDTAPQNQLKPDERRQNLRGAFQVNQPIKIKGQKILLIDDVLTTGHTLNSCGEVLLKNGAQEIWVASFTSVTG